MGSGWVIDRGCVRVWVDGAPCMVFQLWHSLITSGWDFPSLYLYMYHCTMYFDQRWEFTSHCKLHCISACFQPRFACIVPTSASNDSLL